MIKRVVVGVDFSEPSVSAAQWASRAFAPEVELVLTHVMTLPEPSVRRHRDSKQSLTADTLRLGADQKLQALSRTMIPRRVWPALFGGDPATTLAEVADTYQADMIVVASRGERLAVGRFGSTAVDLLRCASVPVLVLHSPAPSPPLHFLVPVQQEQSATWALAVVGAMAGTADRVTLLHVTPSGVLSHVLASGDADVPQPRAGASGPWLRVAARSQLRTGDVRSEEAFGDAAQEIRAAATRLRADYVVMPRRNAGKLRRALLGSVTQKLVSDPPVSVIVVPERARIKRSLTRGVTRPANRQGDRDP